MYGHIRVPFAYSVKAGGHNGGAGSGSAGVCLAASPLPYPHLKRFAVNHLYKFRIHPVREYA